MLTLFLVCWPYFWYGDNISGMLTIFLVCWPYFWSVDHISGLLTIFLVCWPYFGYVDNVAILSCSPALLSWSSSSSVLIFLQFRPAILALQLFGIKLIPGRPGLTLLAFLAYSSSSSSNFNSSAVCNSAVLSHLPSFVSLFLVKICRTLRVLCPPSIEKYFRKHNRLTG